MLWRLGLILVFLSGGCGISSAQASSCDGGYYDPAHQICQPNVPGIPGPGYGPDHTRNGWFDRQHGVTAPYAPAYPPPFYPWQG